MLSGPDVSYAQGTIDWDAVRGAERADELAFAFAKATEGDGLVDPTFEDNWHGIRGIGLVRGAYHYARPTGDASEARHQAHHLLGTLERFGGLHAGDLPPVLDLEACEGLSPTELYNWVGAWVDTIRATIHRDPIIYTDQSFWDTRLPDPSHAFGAPLWAASWGAPPQVPRAWRHWTFWQYTDADRLPGIATPVDMSRFAGDRAALEALAGAPAHRAAAPVHRAAAPVHHAAPPAHRTRPTWPGHVLKRGDRGPEVRLWQEQLRHRGFLTLTADGVFGPHTREACTWLQMYLQERPTGEVDERTWQRTWSAPS